MTSSLLSDFLTGRALPEQWLGLIVLVAIFAGLFVVGIRARIRELRDEAEVRRIMAERDALREAMARLIARRRA